MPLIFHQFVGTYHNEKNGILKISVELLGAVVTTILRSKLEPAIIFK